MNKASSGRPNKSHRRRRNGGSGLRQQTRLNEKLRITEEALHHSTDVLRSMISALPVGVVALDRKGRVELWNHAAESILGYTAAEMVGNTAPITIFTPAGEAVGTAAADVFLRMVTGQLVKGEEVRCRRKDGSAVEALFSGAPLMDASERIQGAICVFEDIGQRQAIARQLHQAQKMEAVGQLTGGMAHDFNNILGIAIGNLDLLEEELAGRKVASDLAQAALDALLRGAELTRALLAFSRRQPLQPTKVNVAELLTATVRVLSRTLGEQIETVLHTEPGLWPAVVDAAQLEASVTNLAINARDAMPGGGRLDISARNVHLEPETAEMEMALPGEYVAVEVCDSGTGMDADTLAHVFEPFFSTKPVGHGTGLGLSMVYGFIKQSGGHIKIYSELGHGTTVRLYLPRAIPDTPHAAQSSAAMAPVRGGRETILVVDDNAEVRRMVEGQLISLGYRVVTAEHGPHALALLEAGLAVDLLFTDIVMPQGMNGFALARAARRLRPGLPVLFTSGFPGSRVETPCGGENGVSFIGKPYRRRDLAARLRDLLDATIG